MTNATLNGKPYAGNPHVRFEVGGSRIGKPRRGSLLYKTIVFALAAMTGLVLQAAERDVIMNVDFGDEMLLYKATGMRSQDVDARVEAMRAAGVRVLSLRMSCLGIAQYRSKKLADVDWAHSVTFEEVNRRRDKSDVLDGFRRLHPDVERGLKATLKLIDPPAEVVRAAHERGMKVWFWVDLFDEMYGKFLFAHPECLVRTADGAVFPGVRDYANERAVAEKLEEIEEMLGYRPDGLYLSTSCHARHLNYSEPDGAFGRVDLTKFIERLSALCKRHSAKLYPGIAMGGDVNFCSPHFSDRVKFTAVTPWRDWIDRGLVDGFVVGDYDQLWQMAGNWRPRGITKVDAKSYPVDVLSKPYLDYARGRAKLYIFSGWIHHMPFGSVAASLKVNGDAVLRHGYDGVLVHEAMIFERQEGNSPDYPHLCELTKRLK